MEQNRNDSPKNNNNKPNDKRPRSRLISLLLIAIAAVMLGSFLFQWFQDAQYEEVDFNDFLVAFREGQLAEVEFHGDRLYYLTKEEAEKAANQQKACFTGLPSGGDYLELTKELEAAGVKVNKKIEEDNSFIMMLLS